MTSLHLLLTDKPAIAPPVFVFQKDKAQKVSLSMLFKNFLRLKPYLIILQTLFILIISLDSIIEKHTLQESCQSQILHFSCSDLQMAQVQRMEKVIQMSKLATFFVITFLILFI